jgi:hypothetical protein
MTSALRKLLTLSGVLAAGTALAHHRSPNSVLDPTADATDLYAWVQGANLVIVADFNGVQTPEAGPIWPRFDENALYEIHIAHGGTSLADALTYQFRFTTTRPAVKNPAASPPVAVPAGGLEIIGSLAGGLAFQQTYSVTQLTNGGTPTVVAMGVPVPPPNAGPTTNTLVYALPNGTTYENRFGDMGNSAGTVHALGNGGLVFAGPRDDPYFEDEGAINDLLQFRPLSNPTEPARDSYAYMNVHAIVLQIPLTVANGGTAVSPTPGQVNQTVGVWASVSRRAATLNRSNGTTAPLGPWRQVSRVGLPLYEAWLIGIQDRDAWRRLTPADDLANFAAYILNPMLVRDANALGYYGIGGPLAACPVANLQTNRADIAGIYNLGLSGITTIGDVLRVDLGATSGFPNGRLLTDHVVDITAGIILCGASGISMLMGVAGPQANEIALPKGGATPAFPYLQPPWEGRSANPRPAPSLP